ncbi:hypothetical protein [Microbacterium sp. NPDC096154]|uniref:hypothetical protein n=1 Tax=Microbacterium sp. NPDC096154 TaxID=3155549 RepID=UPI003329A8E5
MRRASAGASLAIGLFAVVVSLALGLAGWWGSWWILTGCLGAGVFASGLNEYMRGRSGR